VLPPVLVGGMLLIGVLIHYWVWPIAPLPIVPARTLGVALFLAAGLLAHSAHNAMTRAGTNVFPTQPTLALVTDGPFRLTRNPLYVAASGVYLGVAFWVDGLVPLLLFPLVCVGLHYAIVLPEERYLDAKFGEPYRAYRARVNRWL
jgi:protein-S-isoprenylcysteine O-methyltransferase Ste14